MIDACCPGPMASDARGSVRWSRHRAVAAYAPVSSQAGDVKVGSPRSSCPIPSTGGHAMPTTSEKRAAFRRLHTSGCFVIPNPWDRGTARYLQNLGFKALATTSAGAAFSLALPDGAVPRDVMLAHIEAMVASTDLPVNADFGLGFADDPDAMAH